MTFFEREDWRKWSPGCACSEDSSGVELTAYAIANNERRYGIRCSACGRINGGKPVSPSVLTASERAEADRRFVNLGQTREAADKAAEDRYRTTAIKRQAAREAEREKWWAEYDTYLFTRQWRDKRASVLERDNYTCRACLVARATEVHHLTYRHVFNEPLFDLAAVCRPCHEIITAIDRTGVPAEYKERQA